MNPTTKRINWINAGMALLFGFANGNARGVLNSGGPVMGGMYGCIQAMQAWTTEGVAAGFIPATPGGQPPANVVIDTDFTALYPACNAAAFLAAVAALQTLNADYAAFYAAMVQVKP